MIPVFSRVEKRDEKEFVIYVPHENTSPKKSDLETLIFAVDNRDVTKINMYTFPNCEPESVQYKTEEGDFFKINSIGSHNDILYAAIHKKDKLNGNIVHRIHCWLISSGKDITFFDQTHHELKSLAYGEIGSEEYLFALIDGKSEYAIVRYSLRSGKEDFIYKRPVGTSPLSDIAVASEENQLRIYGTTINGIYMWNFENPLPKQIVQGNFGRYLRHTGNDLIASNLDGLITFADLSDSLPIVLNINSTYGIIDIDSKDGEIILGTIDKDNKVNVRISSNIKSLQESEPIIFQQEYKNTPRSLRIKDNYVMVIHGNNAIDAFNYRSPEESISSMHLKNCNLFKYCIQ